MNKTTRTTITYFLFFVLAYLIMYLVTEYNNMQKCSIEPYDNTPYYINLVKNMIRRSIAGTATGEYTIGHSGISDEVLNTTGKQDIIIYLACQRSDCYLMTNKSGSRGTSRNSGQFTSAQANEIDAIIDKNNTVIDTATEKKAFKFAYFDITYNMPSLKINLMSLFDKNINSKNFYIVIYISNIGSKEINLFWKGSGYNDTILKINRMIEAPETFDFVSAIRYKINYTGFKGKKKALIYFRRLDLLNALRQSDIPNTNKITLSPNNIITLGDISNIFSAVNLIDIDNFIYKNYNASEFAKLSNAYAPYNNITPLSTTPNAFFAILIENIDYVDQEKIVKIVVNILKNCAASYYAI